MSGLQELIGLTPPPDAPEGAPFDWVAAEAVLETALPADYKAYCDRYGHGTFNNGWGWFPLTPFAQHAADDLVSTYWRDLLADTNHGKRPFPEPNGVLPFAYSGLKYSFWWLTVGPPDRWPVLFEDDAGTWHQLELTATELLARALRDELFPIADGDERTELAVTFSRFAPFTPQPRPPFVIGGYGTICLGSGAPEDPHVDLDLAGALGGTRQARLNELLAALEPSLRAMIVRAEAKRSMEVLHVRHRADCEPVCAAVQAWADRVSGWS